MYNNPTTYLVEANQICILQTKNYANALYNFQTDKHKNKRLIRVDDISSMVLRRG